MNIIRFHLLCLQTFFFVLSLNAAPEVPTPTHVVIVVEENHDYTQIIGSSAAPYINSIVSDTDAALFTQSFSIMYPSQPNYLMLFSGSSQGITSDSILTKVPCTTANLGALLIAAKKTFKGYCEDLPQAGFEGATSGAYARKHNPWVNWQGTKTYGLPSTSNLPFSAFPSKYDSLPSVAFVIPNLDNDMYNGSDPETITKGDTWLKDHLDGYLQWAKKNNSLLILTFDEGKNAESNHIVTIFAGAMVQHGQYNQKINHYSILRTVEDMFELPYAASSATAAPIIDCWKGKTGTLKIAAHSQVEPLSGLRFFHTLSGAFDKQGRLGGFELSRPMVYDVLGRAILRVYQKKSSENAPACIDANVLSSGMYLLRPYP